MEKLDSLTGRGATSVILSVFAGMRRNVRVKAEARRGEGAYKSHDHVRHEVTRVQRNGVTWMLVVST